MSILGKVSVPCGMNDMLFDLYSKIGASAIETENVIYMFLAPISENKYQIHYIGKTTMKASERLSYHERWPEAVRLGCTRVAIYPLGDAASYIDDIEAALIEEHKPTLNIQHC